MNTEHLHKTFQLIVPGGERPSTQQVVVKGVVIETGDRYRIVDRDCFQYPVFLENVERDLEIGHYVTATGRVIRSKNGQFKVFVSKLKVYNQRLDIYERYGGIIKHQVHVKVPQVSLVIFNDFVIYSGMYYPIKHVDLGTPLKIVISTEILKITVTYMSRCYSGIVIEELGDYGFSDHYDIMTNLIFEDIISVIM